MSAAVTLAERRPRPPDNKAVPKLCVGYARDYVRRLDQGSKQLGDSMRAISAPVRARWRQRGLVRRELLVEAARRWERDLPPLGRLALKIERSGYDLRIAELRVIPGDMRFLHWADDGQESSISVQAITFMVSKKQCMMQDDTLAIISLHALARWFERTARTPNANLDNDLLMLALAHEALLRQSGDFVCPCGHGGRWLGKRVVATFLNDSSDPIDKARTLSVRTFIGADQFEPYGR